MDPLVIQSHANTATVTAVHPRHQAGFNYSPGTQLLDSVTKSFLGIDEWVAQELQRIVENQVPRNCYSYEALISVIEGMNQVYHYPTVIHDHCSQEQVTSSSVLLHEASTCCMNHKQDGALEPNNNNNNNNNSNVTLPSTPTPQEDEIPKLVVDADLILLVTEEEQGEQEAQPQQYPQRQGSSNSTNDTLVKSATINTDRLTQKSLIMAFMTLICYCCKQHKPIHFYLQHHRKLLELLIELENTCDAYESWILPFQAQQGISVPHTETSQDEAKKKEEGIIRIQERLHCILFGNQIPLIDKLVCPWTLISLWVQRGNHQSENHYDINYRDWIEFGVSCYQIAKEVCGIGEIYN